ncbi:MAG: hypothetical protein Q7K43_05525 [Candidatus Woesearchaeota archaeon]|nr:hypothetical protein [Candidatus Woesearchaeota archaeon]
MRALISKEEAERKGKRNQKILVAFLGFIMIASTLGYALQSNDQSTSGETEISYNGYDFVNRNGLWIWGSYVFRNLPQEVPDVGTGLNKEESYQGKPAYIYSENIEAETEILVNLGQIALRVQKACPQGTSCPAEIPRKTCSDNFIIIKEGNNNSIIQDGNCVYIQGAKEQLPALADQFLFKILSIK